MGELTIRGARKQKDLLEWSCRVAECRGSGQTISRWCAEHGVNRKTYYTWQKKVFAAASVQQRYINHTDIHPGCVRDGRGF